MDPIYLDSLRQDHTRLCGELDALEVAQKKGAHTWPFLQEVCARLSTGLHEHIHREKKLLSSGHRSLGAAASETVVRSQIDHYGNYRYLQVITHCIASENRPFLLNSRYQLVVNFLRDLRCHMDLQEAELFPVEQVMSYTGVEEA